MAKTVFLVTPNSDGSPDNAEKLGSVDELITKPFGACSDTRALIVLAEEMGKPDEGAHYLIAEPCQTCNQKPGKARSDAGLKAGCHCDDCWNDIFTIAHQKSW